MPQHTAQLNYLKIAPRKVRAVGALLKGLSANDAEAALLFRRERAAKPILKLLRSALANAKNNARLAPENLYIERIQVDGGPMLKRHMPRARGMATPIQKKMSHVFLVLGERPEGKPPRFTIVVKKKTKVPSETASRPRKGKSVKEEGETSAKPKPRTGIFRRIFSRKSSFGT